MQVQLFFYTFQKDLVVEHGKLEMTLWNFALLAFRCTKETTQTLQVRLMAMIGLTLIKLKPEPPVPYSFAGGCGGK